MLSVVMAVCAVVVVVVVVVVVIFAADVDVVVVTAAAAAAAVESIDAFEVGIAEGGAANVGITSLVCFAGEDTNDGVVVEIETTPSFVEKVSFSGGGFMIIADIVPTASITLLCNFC